jgi:predicted nuclease of predicted toxin-antitoxin system
VKPLGFPLFADENIRPLVLEPLRSRGKRVESVTERGWGGKRDLEPLRTAHERGWVVLTHDGDFARLAIRSGEPFTGIMYLRPGHIRPEFVIETVAAIESTPDDVQPPFIVIAVRLGDRVRARIRRGAR